MTDYSIYKLSVKEIIIMSLVLIALLEVIGILIYNTPYGIVMFPIVYLLYEKRHRENIKKKRLDRMRNQFKDALYSFSSSFATGESMLAAMEKSIVVLNDIYGEGSELARELNEMVKKIRVAGDEEVDLWLDFGRRSHIEDIRDFSEVFASCRDAGGDLARTVDRATEILTEKISVENDIRIMAKQKVTEGRLVGVMPVIMIVFLRVTSPSYMNVMYESLQGRIMMTFCMVITAFAFLITERVTKVEV